MNQIREQREGSCEGFFSWWEFTTGSPLKPQSREPLRIPQTGRWNTGGGHKIKLEGGYCVPPTESGEMVTRLLFAYPKVGDTHSFLR